MESKGFGLKIYNKFPRIYRTLDEKDDLFYLKRYLEALSEGGFEVVIDEINNLYFILDPQKAPVELLPALFNQFGLEIFQGIPETYLRDLLPNLGFAFDKKGSLDVIEFVTSSLSGVKTDTSIQYDEGNNPKVVLRFEMDYNLGGYFPNAEQFNKLLIQFLPFYCDSLIVYSYLFYESSRLIEIEKDGYKVAERKDEQEDLKGLDSIIIQSIEETLKETKSLNVVETFTNLFKYPPFLDEQRLQMIEKHYDTSRVVQVYLAEQETRLSESFKDRVTSNHGEHTTFSYQENKTKGEKVGMVLNNNQSKTNLSVLNSYTDKDKFFRNNQEIRVVFYP